MGEEVKKEEIQEEEQVSEKPLDKMTAPELREIAKEIPGVTGAHAMKKAELLAVVKEAGDTKDEKPEEKKEKKKKKPAKQGAGKNSLKEKILDLRKEKQSARESGDRHGVDILRRRIKRLKRQTRKIAKV
ncbi:MAG: transcription termination factor Rho [Desulfobacterales bacterium]|nr:transcription termination factor Rho [Desulfobacterales bacterium]